MKQKWKWERTGSANAGRNGPVLQKRMAWLLVLALIVTFLPGFGAGMASAEESAQITAEEERTDGTEEQKDPTYTIHYILEYTGEDIIPAETFEAKASDNEEEETVIRAKKIEGYTLIGTGEETEYYWHFDYGDAPVDFTFRYFRTPVLAQTTLHSVKTGRRKLTVTWKKVNGAGGYQIAYRKKGTKSYQIRNGKAGKTSFTIGGLKSGQRYTVKVRAVKTQYETPFYGKWSKVKTVRVS